MKKLTTIALLAAAVIASAQKNTTIHASIKGLKPGKWVYYREQGGDDKRDSVKTIAGGFHTAASVSCDAL